MDVKGGVVPATPSPKPSSVIMPAKKSIAVTAAPAAMPTQFQYPPNFQFGGSVPQYGMPQYAAPNAQYPMSFVQSAPMPTFAAPAAIPVAQPVALPAPVASATGPSAIELMENQMKTMREYIANMEKTFKEAKKGMKKPKVPKDPNAPKNPVPEGTQAWNDFVVLIQKEESDRIRATDPTKGADWKGITRKEAMAKAKELKAAGDPRYTYVKKEKPVAATTAPATTDGAAATDAKKRGRKPKAVAAPALPPTTAIPTIPNASFSFPTFASALPSIAPTSAPAAEEDIVVDEKIINGATYLVSAKNECWHMLPNGDQGAWAGIYNGSIIVPAPEPL